MKLSKASLQWLVLGISGLVLFAASGVRVMHASNDFVPVYSGARCLLHGCDPYQPSQLEPQFFLGGGHPEDLPSWEIDVPVYPPSSFLALSPLAMLRFPVARWVWFVMNGLLFFSAAAVVLSMCPPAHRWLPTLMLSFIVARAGILLVLGQPGTFAISLVILGICLFLRGRLLWLGTGLLLLSLAVKPQIGGFLVLYLLLRKIHWRYAAFAMAGAAAVMACAMLMLHQHKGSAAWNITLRNNLSATLSPGGSADPRPENFQAIGDVNLQSLTSIFVKGAQAFNLAAYVGFLMLLTLGIITAVRVPPTAEAHLLALSALSVVSLLPVYHRFYDTRLLLLAIPATVIVFQQRRLLGSVMAALIVLATVSVQYRIQVVLVQMGVWQRVIENKFLLLALLRQQNLELLLLYGLFLFALGSVEVPASQTRIAFAAAEAV